MLDALNEDGMSNSPNEGVGGEDERVLKRHGR
ncbi:hypothetical protein JOD47_002159 [Arthrobacter tumbae]|nr:hypothetical protein [Arthrobacter tumbae]